MPPKEVTPGQLVVQSVRATLALANEMRGMLSTDELQAMKRVLRRSLAITIEEVNEHQAAAVQGEIFLGVRLHQGAH